MTVNAQPEVRSGSLPTQTPRTIQRPAQPAEQTSAQADQAAAQAAQAEGASTKPKRNYKPRAKRHVAGNVQLTTAEQAAWGRIALKALNKRVTVDRYMAEVMGEHGEEIAVYQKLTAAQSDQTESSEQTEAPAVEA